MCKSVIEMDSPLTKDGGGAEDPEAHLGCPGHVHHGAGDATVEGAEGDAKEERLEGIEEGLPYGRVEGPRRGPSRLRMFLGRHCPPLRTMYE